MSKVQNSRKIEKSAIFGLIRGTKQILLKIYIKTIERFLTKIDLNVDS